MSETGTPESPDTAEACTPEAPDTAELDEYAGEHGGEEEFNPDSVTQEEFDADDLEPVEEFGVNAVEQEEEFGVNAVEQEEFEANTVRHEEKVLDTSKILFVGNVNTYHTKAHELKNYFPHCVNVDMPAKARRGFAHMTFNTKEEVTEIINNPPIIVLHGGRKLYFDYRRTSRTHQMTERYALKVSVAFSMDTLEDTLVLEQFAKSCRLMEMQLEGEPGKDKTVNVDMVYTSDEYIVDVEALREMKIRGKPLDSFSVRGIPMKAAGKKDVTVVVKDCPIDVTDELLEGLFPTACTVVQSKICSGENIRIVTLSFPDASTAMKCIDENRALEIEGCKLNLYLKGSFADPSRKKKGKRKKKKIVPRKIPVKIIRDVPTAPVKQEMDAKLPNIDSQEPSQQESCCLSTKQKKWLRRLKNIKTQQLGEQMKQLKDLKTSVGNKNSSAVEIKKNAIGMHIESMKVLIKRMKESHSTDNESPFGQQKPVGLTNRKRRKLELARKREKKQERRLDRKELELKGPVTKVEEQPSKSHNGGGRPETEYGNFYPCVAAELRGAGTTTGYGNFHPRFESRLRGTGPETGYGNFQPRFGSESRGGGPDTEYGGLHPRLGGGDLRGAGPDTGYGGLHPRLGGGDLRGAGPDTKYGGLHPRLGGGDLRGAGPDTEYGGFHPRLGGGELRGTGPETGYGNFHPRFGSESRGAGPDTEYGGFHPRLGGGELRGPRPEMRYPLFPCFGEGLRGARPETGYGNFEPRFGAGLNSRHDSFRGNHYMDDTDVYY